MPFLFWFLRWIEKRKSEVKSVACWYERKVISFFLYYAFQAWCIWIESLNLFGAFCPSMLLGTIHVHTYNVLRKRGGGVRKWQFFITFSTESNHKEDGRGGQKPQNLDYLIHVELMFKMIYKEFIRWFHQSWVPNTWKFSENIRWIPY